MDSMTASTTAGIQASSALGRLERLEVRSVWINEPAHFTPWLAQEDNLALLSETLGMDLILEAQEQSVGAFYADIVCRNGASDGRVLIENQLERTDHGHLGQVLTYAAGLEAVTVVWIAPRLTDEHRAALDWLNRKTEASVNFFALEIELWRIGDSPPAPKFNVVSKPNDWSAIVAGAARGMEASALTPTKELQRRYWEALGQELRDHSFLKPQKGLPQYWTNISIGRTGARLMASVSSREPYIQAAFDIEDPKQEPHWFPLLLKARDEIDGELGISLPWDDPPDRVKEARMGLRLRPADYQDLTDWPRQHAWLRETLEQLHRTFAPRIKALPLNSRSV